MSTEITVLNPAARPATRPDEPKTALNGAGPIDPAGPVAASGRDAALWRAAQSFEAVFIAEMMAHAGVADGGAFGDSLGGRSGAGGFAEETFRSLLSQEWAEDVAARGGIGLADQIYRSIANAPR
ncbi:MAG: rod-binding protein [Pseudomonadota bacterium]